MGWSFDNTNRPAYGAADWLRNENGERIAHLCFCSECSSLSIEERDVARQLILRAPDQQREIDRLRAALITEVVWAGFRGEYMEPIKMCRLCKQGWPTKTPPQHKPACILAASAAKEDKRDIK